MARDEYSNSSFSQGVKLSTKLFFPARLLRAVCAASLLAASLTSCIPLAATGIAIGASAAIDRRTVGTQIEDQAIQVKVNQRVKEVLPGDDVAYAYVTSHNRRVLLTGLAPDARAKARAEQIAAATENVRSVHNELNVGPPSLVASSARDTLVTARVRSALFQDKGIEATAVRVITDVRTVYLMGLVTREEGQNIARVASQIPGVEKVVTVFDYISEQELAAIQGERAAAAASAPRPVNQ